MGSPTECGFNITEVRKGLSGTPPGVTRVCCCSSELEHVRAKKSKPKQESSFMYERQQCQNCFTTPKPSEPLLLCSQCRQTRYCNAQCQKADWKTHKKICESDEKVREARVKTSTGSCTQEELQEFISIHSLSINTFTMHAVGTTLAPRGCNETNSCLALDLEFAPRYRDDRARRFRFKDAQVVMFKQLNHTYVEQVPMEAYRGQNLPTQMREICQMFAEPGESGLNARCFFQLCDTETSPTLCHSKLYSPDFRNTFILARAKIWL